MHFSVHAVQRSTPTRPLGNVSDFVVENLPRLLAGPAEALQAELAKVEKAVTRGFHDECMDLPDEAARIACVDLAVLANACGHAGLQLPVRLQRLFQGLAARQARLATMLYEDSVLNNPVESDPRLFTAGEAGAAERDFLRLHRSIEASLDTIIRHLDAIADDDDRHARIRECDVAVSEVIASFSAFRAMSMDAFAQFRGFYAAPANGRHFGVSGRFSESINTLRLLLEGKRIGWVIPDYFSELLTNIAYYPSCGRSRMIAALDAAIFHDHAFIDSLAARDDEVKGLAMRLRKFLDTSAGIHFQLAKKYVH